MSVPSSGDFGPTMDGEALPEEPYEALLAGHQNDRALVTGANLTETCDFWDALVR